MARFSLLVKAPPWFQLGTVVFSHGWFHLPPFEWSASERSLAVVGRVRGRPLAAAIQMAKRRTLRVDVHSFDRISAGLKDETESLVRVMLGLDLDVAEFHAQAGDEFAWAKRIGAGPFLRSASVFEDAVKMLATTNCSWALTHNMVTRLVDELGEPAPGGRKAFPSPERMAGKSEAFYRNVIKTGYRAAYFRGLAAGVAAGEIDPQSWANFKGTTAELVRVIRGCPGLGQYAAENLCKLVGRFDGLGIDSWCVKKFQQIHGPARGDVAKAIERKYRRHGRWRGLALWLDLTRDWHENDVFADETVTFRKD